MDALQIGYFKLPDSPLKEKRVELKWAKASKQHFPIFLLDWTVSMDLSTELRLFLRNFIQRNRNPLKMYRPGAAD
jgi:hypothetical protein